MSIRITSSGHNFSFDSLTASDQDVIISLETSKAMLVPTSLLSEEQSVEDHLRAAGINLNPHSEQSVVIRQDDVTSAIVVVATDLLAQINGVYRGQKSFTTPLLTPARGRGHELQISLSEDSSLLTLLLFNGGDRLFAELFEVKGIADVLYWTARVGEGYDLTTYTIYITGGGRDLEKLLKNYYRGVIISL
ncbi:MAG: hypothetical protein SNG02_08335 [Rikenellaceae bacterium]